MTPNRIQNPGFDLDYYRPDHGLVDVDTGEEHKPDVHAVAAQGNPLLHKQPGVRITVFWPNSAPGLCTSNQGRILKVLLNKFFR